LTSPFIVVGTNLSLCYVKKGKAVPVTGRGGP
jgi:hypothetical protein